MLDGIGLNEPTRSIGIGCRANQVFIESEENAVGNLIELEPDLIASDQSYSLSCWIKLTGNQAERTIYSRGSSGDGGKLVFALQYSWHRYIFATVYYEDGTEVSAWSNQPIRPDWNYHIAVNVGQKTMEIFIDGVASGSIELPSGDREMLWNSCWFGGKNRSSFSTMNLQEFRLFPETMPEAYWKMERDSVCDPEFYTLTAIS